MTETLSYTFAPYSVTLLTLEPSPPVTWRPWTGLAGLTIVVVAVATGWVRRSC